MSEASSPQDQDRTLFAPTTPLPDIGELSGNTQVMPPRYEQWQHPSAGEPSVSAQLQERNQAIQFPGNVYTTTVERASDAPATTQSLTGVVQAGDDYFGIVTVGVPDQALTVRRALVHFDPHASGSMARSRLIAEIPDVEAGESPLIVGRRLAALEHADKSMSGNHFSVGVRNGTTIVANIGGSPSHDKPNFTDVFAPNQESTDTKRANAWGQQQPWRLPAREAAMLRPSALRPLPTDTPEQNRPQPREIELGSDGKTHNITHVPPLDTRTNMRRMYGLDADLVATVTLVPTASKLGQSEVLHILDRGVISHGEDWWALYEGGPGMPPDQRYVIIDDTFLRAAHSAQHTQNPRHLSNHAQHMGGIHPVDMRVRSHVEIGRDNWGRLFGDSAGHRVNHHSVVSGRHLALDFHHTDYVSFAVSSSGRNGADIRVMPQQPAATTRPTFTYDRA